MSEGNVYISCWKKVGKRFRLWVKDRPKLVGEGDTFDEATANLFSQVCGELGDGEPYFDFEGGPPKAALDERYGDPPFVVLAGNDNAEGHTPWRAFSTRDLQFGLYEGGYCDFCNAPVGKRTTRRASFSSLPNADAALSSVGGRNPLFSEAFRALLDRSDMKHCKFQPVERTDGGNKQFYELVGEPLAPTVGVATLERLRKTNKNMATGYYCPKCQRTQNINYFSSSCDASQFVVRKDLPKRLPSCFVIGQAGELELCMSMDRWNKLRGKPGTRGIVSLRLGIVHDDRDVVRNPKARRLKRTDSPYGQRPTRDVEDAKRERDPELLARLKQNMPELEYLLKEVNSERIYERHVELYYEPDHHILQVQGAIYKISELLKRLTPRISKGMASTFRRLLDNALRVKFRQNAGGDYWQTQAGPILEAFLHAKFFLEMAVKYGKELKEPPNEVPPGWEALLRLYQLRKA